MILLTETFSSVFPSRDSSLVNIIENSKIYDSFQHELEDYVRKQKARGLQPEVCFRKVTEDSEYRERGHPTPRPLMLEQGPSFTRTHTFSSSHTRPRTAENQLPPWSKLQHSRLESLNHCHKTHDHFSKHLWLPSPPLQGKTPDPHAARRGKDTSRIREEGPTRAHQAGDQDQGQGRRSREDTTRGSRERGRDSIARMEIPTKRPKKRPRYSQSAQRSPNSGRSTTKAPQRREEGSRGQRSDLAKKARRRGTCGMKLSLAVVTDGGGLGSPILNYLDNVGKAGLNGIEAILWPPLGRK